MMVKVLGGSWEGTVYDPILDCYHMMIRSTQKVCPEYLGLSEMFAELAEDGFATSLEGKRVRITVEVVDDD